MILLSHISRADDHSDDWQLATSVIVGTTVSGQHEVEGDSDFFKFTALANHYYRIETFGLLPAGTSDTVIILYEVSDQSLKKLAEDDQSGTETNASKILWVAPRTDTFYLEIFQFYSSVKAVSYKFVIQDRGIIQDDHGNHPDETATPLVVDSSPTVGNIETSGDVDFFYFITQQDRFYDIETFDLGLGSDTVIRLYSADGSVVIAEDDQSGRQVNASRIVWKATENKAYVRVSQFLSSGTGTYKVGVRDEGTALPVIPDGTPVAGNLSAAGEIEVYQFPAITGHSYRINLQTDNLYNRFKVTVLDRDGVIPLASNSFSEPNFWWIAPQTGIYFLVIREDVEGGDFDLSVSDEGLPPPQADLDGDGIVEHKDLLLFQSQWQKILQPR